MVTVALPYDGLVAVILKFPLWQSRCCGWKEAEKTDPPKSEGTPTVSEPAGLMDTLATCPAYEACPVSATISRGQVQQRRESVE
jgi:hypothetical protein